MSLISMQDNKDDPYKVNNGQPKKPKKEGTLDGIRERREVGGVAYGEIKVQYEDGKIEKANASLPLDEFSSWGEIDIYNDNNTPTLYYCVGRRDMSIITGFGKGRYGITKKLKLTDKVLSVITGCVEINGKLFTAPCVIEVTDTKEITSRDETIVAWYDL